MCIDKKEYILNAENGRMVHPILLKLLTEEQLALNFSIKNGSVISPNIKKLKKTTDDDVLDFLSDENLENIALRIMNDKHHCIDKKDKNKYFVPQDIINKKLLNMVNENYSIKNVEYLIGGSDKSRKFTYFDVLVLRSVYNIYRNGLMEFNVNSIYKQLFQCFDENPSIKKDTQAMIEESLEYLASINIKLNAYKVFEYSGTILPIKRIDDANTRNVRYILKDEPILYSFACDTKNYFLDNDNIYKFKQGKKNIKNLVLYTKLLDFIITIKRSKKYVMVMNLSTIFDECNFTFNSSAAKKDKIDLIKNYLSFFQEEYLIDHYELTSLKRQYVSIKVYIHSYKKRKKKSVKKALFEVRDNINEILEKRRLEKKKEEALSSKKYDAFTSEEHDTSTSGYSDYANLCPFENDETLPF